MEVARRGAEKEIFFLGFRKDTGSAKKVPGHILLNPYLLGFPRPCSSREFTRRISIEFYPWLRFLYFLFLFVEIIFQVIYSTIHSFILVVS